MFNPSSQRSPLLLLCSLLCLMVAWLVPGSHAWADERVNPIEGTIDTGSDYTLLTNETPGMVIVLTYEQIQARGYRSVYEILRDLPGFSTRGAFGQSPVTVAIDGEQSQNNEKFLLFIDGVREQDLWRRSIWLAYQYSVHFIKNITVYYGPGATRFGANALSAVIFIDTKKAEDLQGYGEVSLTKDVRNGMWSLDLMLGHSYNKRTSPKLAKNLFSWYLRGRLYLSDERNNSYNSRWTLQNPSVASFINARVNEYCDDYKRAYGIKTDGCNDPSIQNALNAYRSRIGDEFINDRSNSGLFANPSYINRNQTFSGETGLRFDNWFLRFYIWAMDTGPGLRYPAYREQTNSLWSVRNLSLSLHHLKSELWSSGVGEKAQVIYFNLNITYQRHETPGSSLRVRFSKFQRIFYGQTCTDPTGANQIPCTWNEYLWNPTYHFVVSSSFRAEPKLDFRLLEGRLKFSVGINTGVAFIQGNYALSNRPNPENFASPPTERGAGNQYEHTYFSGFLLGEVHFTKWLIANIGLRSDWEFVRGSLEVVPNCERPLTPCYRFSSPLVGRASLIAKPSSKLQFRLSYGYAFLSPSNWQLFGNELRTEQSARDLLPQDKHSVEFNTYINASDRFFITLSVFHHWLNNIDAIIVLPFRQNESRNFNIGNQITLGGRMYAIFRATSWLDIIANMAVLWPRLDVTNDNNPDPILLSDVPLVQGNVAVDVRTSPYDTSHFFGSLRVNFQTGRQNVGFEQLENGQIEVKKNPDESTNFFVVFHLSAGYLWRPPENFPFLKKLSISVVSENLFSLSPGQPLWTYYDLGIRSGREPNFNATVPQPGLNAFFSLSAGF